MLDGLRLYFPENFQYPYISRSVTEFWRRWHISLGTWFRDYVYIPLGGNRVPRARWVLNLAVVWALTGLWHGAAWNFVAWGLLFAVLLNLIAALAVLVVFPADQHGGLSIARVRMLVRRLCRFRADALAALLCVAGIRVAVYLRHRVTGIRMLVRLHLRKRTPH